MFQPNEKPHHLRGAALELNELFDKIEDLLDRHGPPVEFPKSLSKARRDAVLTIVDYDLTMTRRYRDLEGDAQAALSNSS